MNMPGARCCCCCFGATVMEGDAAAEAGAGPWRSRESPETSGSPPASPRDGGGPAPDASASCDRRNSLAQLRKTRLSDPHSAWILAAAALPERRWGRNAIMTCSSVA